MSGVKYVTNAPNKNAGAVPVDTLIKTTTTTDGEVQHVNIDSSALPSGAATAAAQALLLAELQNKADTTDIQPVTIQDASGNSSLDSATAAIMIVNYEHHEIHSGSHYFVRGYQDISINNVLDFTWLMPDTTKWNTGRGK